MARTRNPTYPDRVVYQLCRRRARPFKKSELVEEVIQHMEDSGDKVTKVSRAHIKNHINWLILHRLIVRAAEGRRKLSAHFEEVVTKLSRSTFTELSLRKVSELVKLQVYPIKNITKKQLYNLCIKTQEERDDAIDARDAAWRERDAAVEAIAQERDTVTKERDQLRQERNAVMEEFDSYRVAAELTTLHPVRDEDPNGECPMEIETNDEAYANTDTTPPPTSTLVSGLHRVPTIPDIPQGSMTPTRGFSSHNLLTPPPTVPQNRLPLSRNPSMVSYLDPEERPGGTQADVVGLSRTPDVSPSTPSRQRHVAPLTPSTLPRNNAPEVTLDGLQQTVSTFVEQQKQRDRLRDQTERNLREQLYVAAQEKQTLQDQLNASAEENTQLTQQLRTLRNEIVQHQQAIDDYERKLAQSEERRLEQTLLFQEAQATIAYLRQRTAALSSQIMQLVNENADVLTLANTRISALTADFISSLDTIIDLKQAAHAFMQWVGVNLGPIAQNPGGHWPAAWQN